MAETPDELRQTMKLDFVMADPEGSAPLRVVAGHCRRVGTAWLQVGDEMEGLADSLDQLVAGAAPSKEQSNG